MINVCFSATAGIFARAEPVFGVSLPGAHQPGASGDAGVPGAGWVLPTHPGVS